MMFGGRHELGSRPGTENVAAAAALAAAAADVEYLRPDLRDRLESGFSARIPDVRVICDGSDRAPNTSCCAVEGMEGEAIVIALDLRGFCVSSGSACSSGAVEPSHVLTAIGLTSREAKSCIRVSLGRGTTDRRNRCVRRRTRGRHTRNCEIVTGLCRPCVKVRIAVAMSGGVDSSVVAGIMARSGRRRSA